MKEDTKLIIFTVVSFIAMIGLVACFHYFFPSNCDIGLSTEELVWWIIITS